MPEIDRDSRGGLPTTWRNLQQTGSNFHTNIDQSIHTAGRKSVAFLIRAALPSEVEFVGDETKDHISKAIHDGNAVMIFYAHPGQNETLGIPAVWTKEFPESRNRPMQQTVAAHMMDIPGLKPLARVGGVTLNSLVTVDTQNKVILHNTREQLKKGNDAVLMPLPKVGEGLPKVARSVLKTAKAGGTPLLGVQGGRRSYLDEEIPSFLEMEDADITKRISTEKTMTSRNTQKTPEFSAHFSDAIDPELLLPIGTFPNEPVKQFVNLVRREKIVFVAIGVQVNGISDYTEVKHFTRRPFTYRISEPMSVDYLLGQEGTPDQVVFSVLNDLSDPIYQAKNSRPLKLEKK